jgi:hypothetical protein
MSACRLRPSFPFAPITAVIVLGERRRERAFVLPDRARLALTTGAAGMLDGLGKVAAAHLTGADAAHIDALNELVRRHLSAVVTAAAEDARERTLFLRAGPPAAPLLRT